MSYFVRGARERDQDGRAARLNAESHDAGLKIIDRWHDLELALAREAGNKRAARAGLIAVARSPQQDPPLPI